MVYFNIAGRLFKFLNCNQVKNSKINSLANFTHNNYINNFMYYMYINFIMIVSLTINVIFNLLSKHMLLYTLSGAISSICNNVLLTLKFLVVLQDKVPYSNNVCNLFCINIFCNQFCNLFCNLFCTHDITSLYNV